MDLIKWIIATAPEIFLLLAVAIGTVLAARILRLLDRYHGVHPDRFGHPRPTWHFYDPGAAQDGPVQPVCVHDWLPLGTRVLCFAEPTHTGAGRPGTGPWVNRPLF